MAAKRIRCICGKVYNPEESKACPSCGVEVRVESISIVAPAAAETPSAVVAPLAAVQNTVGAKPPGPRKIPWLWIGGGVWLAALIIATAMHLINPPHKTVLPAVVQIIRNEDGGAPVKNSLSADEAATKQAAAEKKAAPAAKSGDPAVARKDEPAPADKDEGTTPPPKTRGPDGLRKSGGQWIVEANDSEEAAGAALAEALEKAAEGETVLLKPGTYAGEFTIRDKVRLAGEAGAAPPVIKVTSKHGQMEVKQPGASLENLKIVFAGEGKRQGLMLSPQSALTLVGCEIQSTGGNCVMTTPQSSIDATRCVFSSRGSVAVLLIKARGKFTGCTFSNSLTGLVAGADSAADLNGCTFEKCGPKNGPHDGAKAEEGYIINATGPATGKVTATDCKFTGNSGGIWVTEGIPLSLVHCAFSDNGIPAESDLWTQGILAVAGGSRAVLTGVTFEGDRQGIGVHLGGSLDMTDCHLTRVGLRECRKEIGLTRNAIFVRGRGATARLKKCDFTEAPGDAAVYASDGGAIEAEDCEIRNAAGFAFYAGTGRDEVPCRVLLKGGRIVNNRAGLKVATGGSGAVEGTEFRQNGTGIEVADAGTSVTIRKAVLAENRDVALLIVSRAEASFTDCAIENNVTSGAQVGVTGRPESRADLTLENCRIGSNPEFDVKAGTQSRLTVKHCTWTGPGGSPKLNIEKQAISQFDPPLGGLAGNVSFPAKKTKQGSPDDAPSRPGPPQRSNPPRMPPPSQDPVGQAIDAINKLRRIIR